MFQDRFRGALLARPAVMQNAALDTTRQANAASIAVNHPAIAAWKDEQGHQVRWQVAVPVISLERQEVGIPVRPGPMPARSKPPRTRSNDEDGSKELEPPGSVIYAAEPSSPLPLQAIGIPRLPKPGSRITRRTQ